MAKFRKPQEYSQAEQPDAGPQENPAVRAEENIDAGPVEAPAVKPKETPARMHVCPVKGCGSVYMDKTILEKHLARVHLLPKPENRNKPAARNKDIKLA